MKTISILTTLLLAVVMYSCSDKDEQVLNEEQSSSYVGLVTGIKVEPYVSDEMKSILAMLDTCTSPIPIDKLIPGFENYSKAVPDSITRLHTKSTTISQDGIYTVVKGYTNYSTLYTGVQATINAVQAQNFNFAAGTYYITCQAVTAVVATGGASVFPVLLNTDIMGVDPNNSEQRGYNVTTIQANTYYQFTTYIWGIAYTSANEIFYWIPAIPDPFSHESDFRRNMQWRYLAIQ